MQSLARAAPRMGAAAPCPAPPRSSSSSSSSVPQKLVLLSASSSSSPARLPDWRARLSRSDAARETKTTTVRRRPRRPVATRASSAAAAASASGDDADGDARDGKPPAGANTANAAVTRELLLIAAPMLAALACDPIASLVDTAMLGRLGAVQLAASGAALSVFNTCAKVVNMPLLAATTSSVAQARGERERRERERGGEEGPQQQQQQQQPKPTDDDPRSSAATSAVALALAVGFVQAAVLAAAGGGAAALAAWGVPVGSPLRPDAEAFLVVRALGAPATAALLVLQGVYRGLGDAAPTFRAALAATALNVALGYFLIFKAGLGCAGAALATGAAQLLPAIWLAAKLGKRHGIRPSWDASTLGALLALLGPAGWLVLRTVSVTGAYAAATALATRAGGIGGAGASAAAAAAHQVAFGLWLAASLLSDALAVAAQSLLARSAAAGDRVAARLVVKRAVSMALGLGLALGAIIALASRPLARLFTSDPSVLALLDGTLMPIVAATQPVNALAFVLDGVLYGAGGFRFAAVQMFCCAVPAVAVMGGFGGGFGGCGGLLPWSFGGTASGASAGAAARLAWVWAGLSLLMSGRAASIAVALALRRGPFRRLLADEDDDDGGGGRGAAATLKQA